MALRVVVSNRSRRMKRALTSHPERDDRSTRRYLVEALGGELHISAVFEDEAVEIVTGS